MKERDLIDGVFPATRFSLLERAGSESISGERPALNELLGRYRPALLSHLVRRKGRSVDDAEDLVNEFIASKVLTADFLNRVDRRKGKFRTYLLTCLDNFLRDVVRRENAAKRSPGHGKIVDIDERRDEATTCDSDHREYDLEWARTVIQGALSRMNAECQTNKDERLWRLFEARIVKPLLFGEAEPNYDQVIQEYGFDSYSQATKAMTKAKRLYLQCLRQEVGQYTLEPSAIDEEINDLKKILAGSGG